MGVAALVFWLTVVLPSLLLVSYECMFTSTWHDEWGIDDLLGHTLSKDKTVNITYSTHQFYTHSSCSPYFTHLPRSLSREMWQFQPLSRPIFSEKTRDRSSFSLLKWTNLIQARSSWSISCTYFINSFTLVLPIL